MLTSDNTAVKAQNIKNHYKKHEMNSDTKYERHPGAVVAAWR